MRLRAFAAAVLLALIAILAVPLAARAQPFAYVPNFIDNTVSVVAVNATPPAVAATLSLLPALPTHVVVNPKGSRIYVGMTTHGLISVIDSTTKSVIAFTSLFSPLDQGGPKGMAINDTGTRLYVTTDGAGGPMLFVLDATTGAIVGHASVSANPAAVAFVAGSPNRVYVAHNQPTLATVDVIDVSASTPVVMSGAGLPIAIANQPTGIAVSPSGDRVYVASDVGSGVLSVINTTTNQVTPITPASTGAHDVAVNPVTGEVYVTGTSGGDIDEFLPDGTSLGAFGTITANSGTWTNQGISVAPDGLSLLVVNAANNAVEEFAIPNSVPSVLISVGTDPEARGNFIGPSVIQYAPGPPTAVTGVSSAPGQATVSFTPPGPTPGGTSDPAVGTYTYTVTATPTLGGSTVISAPGPAPSITVIGLTNGLQYTFTVVATSTNGDSFPSAPATATVQASAPNPPTGVTAVAGHASATVSFTAPLSDGGAAIFQYTATSSPSGIAQSGSGSPIVVGGLTNGTHYTFTVTAQNSVGSSLASSASNDVVPTDVPQPPILTTTTAGNQQVTVAFTPPADTGGLPITGYTVTSSPGGFTGTGTSSPITVTGLTNLTAYTFTVTAANTDGTSAASNASASVTPFVAPGAPTGVSAAPIAIGALAVTCTAPISAGDAPGGITSYTATASPGGNISSAPTCFIPMTGLTVGTAYTFTVVANTGLGSGPASAPSSPVVAATAPGAPTGVVATATGPTSASVAFTPPASDGGTPITFYNIHATPALASDIGAASSPGIVLGLTPGVSYTFTVTAFNAAGVGPPSVSSNSIVPVVSPVASVRALGGDGQATVTFTTPSSLPPSPVTSYTATSSPGGITASSAGARPLVAVPGLTDGTEYTFTVTTHHLDGSSETSAASNAVTPAKLPARTNPWAYVASANDGVVAVIDTGTDRVINAIDMGGATRPFGVAVSPDGAHVYVALFSGVAVIDAASQSVVATIPIADVPTFLAVDPSGAHVYSGNFANSVSVIDTATNTVTDTIPVTSQPLGIDVDPTGASIYVSLGTESKIVRIDAASKAVTPSAALGFAPTGLAAAAGGVLYAADGSGGQLVTLDGPTLAVQSTTTFPAGQGADTVAVDPSSGHVFFVRGPTAGGPGSVNELGGGTAPAGTNATAISLTPSGGKIYVTNTIDATVTVVDAASMTVTATIPVGHGSFSIGKFIAPAEANPPRLGAISTRMQVLTGDNVLIGGFIISGSTPKTVVVRARGPSLAAAGITNFLANPLLQLVFGDGTVLTNDDWQSAANAAQITSSGFAPSDSRESAILVTLQPGPYTAIVSGVGGGTGVGIVEVFEVDHPENPMAGISTRGFVSTGDSVMIGGIIIQGSAPQTVIVRARGPSLAAQGVASPLSNPLLQLVASDGTVLTNDDWQSAGNAAQIQSSGFAPADPRESAILVTLNPGAYTAIVSGVGGATGVGIVEVFTVP